MPSKGFLLKLQMQKFSLHFKETLAVKPSALYLGGKLINTQTCLVFCLKVETESIYCWTWQHSGKTKKLKHKIDQVTKSHIITMKNVTKTFQFKGQMEPHVLVNICWRKNPFHWSNFFILSTKCCLGFIDVKTEKHEKPSH